MFPSMSDQPRFFKLVIAAKSLQHRFGRATMMTRWIYHLQYQTPLMAAVMSGQYEGAAALVARGARLDVRNARGWTGLRFCTRAVSARLSEAGF